jgi:hypothetical protein
MALADENVMYNEHSKKYSKKANDGACKGSFL